jgi:hypothetical protein
MSIEPFEAAGQDLLDRLIVSRDAYHQILESER